MSDAVFLNAMGVVCALGSDKRLIRQAILGSHVAGVQSWADILPGRRLHLGKYIGELPDIDDLPVAQRSRNNALLLAALAQIRIEVNDAIDTFGPKRIAIVLGTSTSGIGESERAIANYQQQGKLPPEFNVSQQELGSPALMLAEYLQLQGPAIVISTACSSSAKALASAARMLRAGLCDAVICGGMDALCSFTVAGFSALDSVSDARCNPMSINRNGINIGEGGALFLMTRQTGAIMLAGYGESVDAYHISAPDPNGGGARTAIQTALQRSGVRAEQIDYINLHGTATQQNDAMESKVVAEIFGETVPCSSTKPLTGHTLGGAGALEAAICWLLLQENDSGYLPPHWWDGCRDNNVADLQLVKPGQILGRPMKYVLSNSFAFGGSNASLILGRG